MAGRTIVGSRIRERRIILGLRQVDLARRVGISGSYLNLIEHNRRRIGGKLLVDVAGILGVSPSLLSEGAEAALLAILDEAAAGQDLIQADHADEFAGRFPAWAQVLAASHARAASLAHIVETLTDRLTHDPHLAASLHEVISSVTAIRSTAAILVDTKELEPEWRARFQRNIGEDSRRLADSAQSLAAYLDGAANTETTRATSPQEEFENFLNANQFHFNALEDGQFGAPEVIIKAADTLGTETAKILAHRHLERYQKDAKAMPLEDIMRIIGENGPDLMVLGQMFGVEMATVLRRLACLPMQEGRDPIGLAICDASGTMTFCKPVPGFPMPRFGSACPLWPLFSALNRPMVPLRVAMTQSGRDGGNFIGTAISQPVAQAAFNQEPLYEAYMMVVPDRGEAAGNTRRKIGVSCRICAKTDCLGRREPSIMA